MPWIKKGPFILHPWRPWHIESALLTFGCRDFLKTAQRFILGAFNRTAAIEMLSFHPGVVGPFSHNALKKTRSKFKSNVLKPKHGSPDEPLEMENEVRANRGPRLLPEMTNETIKRFNPSWSIRWEDSRAPDNLSFNKRTGDSSRLLTTWMFLLALYL